MESEAGSQSNKQSSFQIRRSVHRTSRKPSESRLPNCSWWNSKSSYLGKESSELMNKPSWRWLAPEACCRGLRGTRNLAFWKPQGQLSPLLQYFFALCAWQGIRSDFTLDSGISFPHRKRDSGARAQALHSSLPDGARTSSAAHFRFRAGRLRGCGPVFPDGPQPTGERDGGQHIRWEVNLLTSRVSADLEILLSACRAPLRSLFLGGM